MKEKDIFQGTLRFPVWMTGEVVVISIEIGTLDVLVLPSDIFVLLVLSDIPRCPYT